MPTSHPKRKHRLFQFSLRWLLVVMTVVGVGIGLLVKEVRQRRAAIAMLHERAEGVQYKHGLFYVGTEKRYDISRLPAPGWLVRIFGEEIFLEPAEIWFSGPQLADEDLAYLPTWNSIRLLHLMDCESLTGRYAEHLAKLTSLEVLLLMRAKISDDKLSFLSNLANLQNLYLSRMGVTDAAIPSIVELKSLRSLTLLNCPITDSACKELGTMTSLQKLSLSGTQIGDAGLAHLSELPNLVHLRVNHTRISDGGLRFVAKMQNLEELGLSATSITDAGLAKLHGLKNLKKIQLHSTNVTEKGKTEILDAIPNLVIRD